jgi:hypothetical protein
MAAAAAAVSCILNYACGLKLDNKHSRRFADVAAAGAANSFDFRYACGLKLDDKHSMALVKEAVLRNKHVGNYR